jgi:hypothetical protein
MIWRTKMQARVQGRVQPKEFNFASSESKLVPTNWDQEPYLEWALVSGKQEILL